MRTFHENGTSVSISCVLASFLKISKIKSTKFSTREINYKCRFAKFNTREKSIFKKFRESRNLIRAKLNTFKVNRMYLAVKKSVKRNNLIKYENHIFYVKYHTNCSVPNKNFNARSVSTKTQHAETDLEP